MMIVSRRRLLRVLCPVALVGLSWACTASYPASAPGAITPAAFASRSPLTGLAATLASSELVVGPNRLAFVLLVDGKPINQPNALVELYRIAGQSATKQAESIAIYRTPEGGERGVYSARVNFDAVGAWGLQFTAAVRSDQPAQSVRLNVDVAGQSSSPLPGQRAIASRNPTARDVADLSSICSAQPPCSLHQRSVAEALQAGLPAVIAFATPGYCTSQTCAPVLGEVVKAADRWGDRATFVHVEIYKNPRELTVAEAVNEWGLRSEPWTYLVDRGGAVVDRLEGLTNYAELESALQPLV